MVASFGSLVHLVSLKSAITYYCMLAQEEVLDTPLDKLTHLYTSTLLTGSWVNEWNPLTLRAGSFYNVYR